MPAAPSAKRSLRLSILLLGLAGLAFTPGLAEARDAKAARKAAPAAAPARQALDPALWDGLAWREVGPYRGGRSAAVAGIPGDRSTYYFGATGGGVWKTTDAGRTWKNVSDGFFGGSIGAVAVSEWDPNVVYVGGGEKTVRGNVSHGDGVWKSTDAGRTWKHVGLADSRHVPRIRIHPKDPDRVYAAVLGHLFGPNDQRGVYRSKDGGATWERVLFVDDQVGAVDLVMDPTNPRILYAGTWRVLRTPYSLESGGPGSGLWKSTDGGDTWTELTGNAGLPRGTVGIVGITVSPSNPDNLYAIVEAEDGGVFRSQDAGKTWTKTNEQRDLRQRAWYYTRIYADPRDEESVYVLNVRFHRSKDGGKTFTSIRVPHGDNHDLWIDPADPLRMVESNDGGANVSTDGGETWTAQDNQPTAQMYRVSTDNHFPYRILGAQQDNSAVRILSRGQGGGIGRQDWDVTAGGESGHIVADPQDPDVVYGGSYGGFLTRYNHRTGELRDVNAWPDNPMGWGAAELKVRFQWNFPIFFSPHDPDTLYAAGNVLFKSTDEGQSWQAISPDLTRDDKTRQGPSGGPITKDNTSVEYYGTIFAAAESPLEKGVLWAGSDDGLVQVSRDGGASWRNVTPPGLPEWALINSLEAHPFEQGGLYVAATRYKLDDFEPYLFRTTDYGRTWSRIDAGIDRSHFTRVVRADPERRGLLFAGTERGVYASFDDGGRWHPLQLNLPEVPVTDLTVKGNDLVAATQGRGLWVLDDLAPLRQASSPELPGLHLFRPSPAVRVTGTWTPPRPIPGLGTNPPAGAVVYYALPEALPGERARELKLEFLAADGAVIRTFRGKPAEPEKKAGEQAEPETKEEAEAAGEPGQEQKEEEEEEEEEEEKKAGAEEDEPAIVPAEKGLNRFAWDLVYPAGRGFDGLILWSGDPIAPVAVPGEYRVRLTLGDRVLEEPLTIVADPRSSSSQEDLEAQFRFLLEARDKLTEAHDAIRRIREVRGQLDGLRKRLDGEPWAEVRAAAKSLDEKMTAVEEALYQTKNRSPQDPLNFPVRLNDKLNAVAGSAAIGDFRPTRQAVEVKRELAAAIDAELEKLRRIWEEDLAALNRLAEDRGVSAVILGEARLQ
jgi:photosystem II stability/assembly factor-like uncharacterized protein